MIGCFLLCPAWLVETCWTSQYCVKAPFSTDMPGRQGLQSEWSKGEAGGKKGFLRWLLLTEMNSLGFTTIKDKRTWRLVGLLCSSTHPSRTNTFTHGILNQGKNEITSEKRPVHNKQNKGEGGW